MGWDGCILTGGGSDIYLGWVAGISFRDIQLDGYMVLDKFTVHIITFILAYHAYLCIHI